MTNAEFQTLYSNIKGATKVCPLCNKIIYPEVKINDNDGTCEIRISSNEINSETPNSVSHIYGVCDDCVRKA